MTAIPGNKLIVLFTKIVMRNELIRMWQMYLLEMIIHILHVLALRLILSTKQPFRVKV
jgi:hypothetical protein